MAKKVLFRVNAGKKYGLGHLSRNLVIARELSKKQWEYNFLVKTDDSDFVEEFLKQREEGYYKLIEDDISQTEDINSLIQCYKKQCSFLILDHYDHNYAYQIKLKEQGIQWAQYDYAMKNNIIADMVINPNIGVLAENYTGLINDNTSLCVGEKYALIDERIKNIKARRNAGINTVLIAFGGGNYPKTIVDIINEIIQNKEYTFLIVTQDDRLKKKIGERENVEIGADHETLLKFYKQASCAIVAGGVTTYELVYLGIPMIIVPFAENQIRNAKEWDNNKCAISYLDTDSFLNEYRDKGLDRIFSDLRKRVNPKTEKIDGNGAECIVEKIVELLE